jgi:hypothetical protein
MRKHELLVWVSGNALGLGLGFAALTGPPAGLDEKSSIVNGE